MRFKTKFTSLLLLGSFAAGLAFPAYAESEQEVTVEYTLPTLPDGALDRFYEELFASDGEAQPYALSEGNYIRYINNGLSSAQIAEQDAAIEKIVAGIDPSWSDLNKALYVNDYIDINCAYDETYSNYDAYDCLVLGTSVCQGYAEAYWLVMDRLGIDCKIISSSQINHAWNIIYIDGQWYHVDVTWNDPIPDSEGRARHQYFLISDDLISSSDYKHAATDWELRYEGYLDGHGYATSPNFDNMFWKNSDVPVQFIGDQYIYAGKSGINKRTLYGVEETLVDLSNVKWYLRDKPGYYWKGIYTGCSIYNGRVYYNTPEDVRSCLPDGSNDRAEYSLTAAELSYGSIYGSRVGDFGISYRLSPGNEYSEITSAPFKTIPHKVETAVVSGLSAVGGNKSISLTWDAVSGAEKYRIQRLNGSNWESIAFTETNSYTDAALSDGTEYSYRVLVFTGAWGEPCEAVSARTNAAAPVKVTGLVGTPANGQITLKWNAVSGATSYRVQQYFHDGGWKSISFPKTNSFTHTGLTNGAAYSYRVLAYVGGKWGTPTAGIKVRAGGGTNPSGLTATPGNGQITLKWNAVSGATRYRVQQYFHGEGWKSIAFPRTNSFTHTGLINGAAYSYRVLAYVDGKWGTPSAGLKARVGA